MHCRRGRVMTTEVRIASCSCGQLTLTISAAPVRVSVCHCLACQRRTGSVFGTQARFPTDRVVVNGNSSRYLRIGDGGGRTTYDFCPFCGSTVCYSTEGQERLTAVPVGAFSDPGFPAPIVSCYETRKHPWVVLPEGIEREDEEVDRSG